MTVASAVFAERRFFNFRWANFGKCATKGQKQFPRGEGRAVKYSSNEAFARIMNKSREIRTKRENRVTALLSAACVTLAILLVGTVIILKGQIVSEVTGSRFGAFLLPSEDGGYVLAAVIAFLLGIAATLWAIRCRNGKKNKDDKEDKER